MPNHMSSVVFAALWSITTLLYKPGVGAEKQTYLSFGGIFHISEVEDMVTFEYAVQSLTDNNVTSTKFNITSLVRLISDPDAVVAQERDLLELQDLISLSSNPNGPKIGTRRLPDDKDFGPLLKEIKTRVEETHIIVYSDLLVAKKLLHTASSFSMTAEYYHYIFANFDVYTLDFEFFKETGANITALRFVDTESPKTAQLVNGLRLYMIEQTRKVKPTFVLPPPPAVPTTLAVLYDSVYMIADALKRSTGEIVAQKINCTREDSTWKNGSTFMNVVKMTDYHGTTGRIRLNSDGQRTRYALTVVELTKNGFDKLGHWTEESKLNITKNYELSLSEVIETLENKTLVVTVYLEEPFVMLKESEEPLFGNDRYEGYCVDLLEKIAEHRQFKFKIQEVSDKSYGSKDSRGRWNGMVGELQRGDADLAVAALTISYSRSEVIDFTVPFMHLGISILFKKPEKKDPSLFTFLSPLSLDVWLYMLAAYVGVSLMLWILARFSPYEWYNPHPCNPETDVVENQFNLLNSLWFTVGSLMQQGSDLTPRAASTRLVAGIWWFFTLILISSYTANLAAFLTVERMVSPIENADDLAKQTKIKYGTLGSGSTMTFFNESRIQTYERMWQFMENQPNVFVNSSKAGIQRVKNGEYAYLMESSMLEYAIERDCELMQIGGLLDSKGYGIGLPKGSPYREPISTAILRLQEKTVLTELKDKWWKQRRGGGRCKTEEGGKKGGHNELGLQNVGGVFVVLVGGLLVAFFIAIIEFVHKSRKNAEADRLPLCSEMWEELKFAMRCHGSKKPVRASTHSNIRRHSYSDVDTLSSNRGFVIPPLGGAAYAPVHAKDHQLTDPMIRPDRYSVRGGDEDGGAFNHSHRP